MATPALPETVQDPVTDDFITTAWGDQVNTTIAYALRDRPHCRVYNDANISIPNNAGTVVTFNTERVDVGAMHSTASNTGRVTAVDAGFYLIATTVEWASNNAGERLVDLRLNGVTAIARTRYVVATTTATTHAMSLSTMYQMAAADYVEVVVFQNSGGALNIQTGANFSPELSVMWMAT